MRSLLLLIAFFAGFGPSFAQPDTLLDFIPPSFFLGQTSRLEAKKIVMIWEVENISTYPVYCPTVIYITPDSPISNRWAVNTLLAPGKKREVEFHVSSTPPDKRTVQLFPPTTWLREGIMVIKGRKKNGQPAEQHVRVAIHGRYDEEQHADSLRKNRLK